MIISCNNCEPVLSRYLCDLPGRWREQVVKTLCKVLTDNDIDCDHVKDCETLTKLSAFKQEGNTIKITYTDERGDEFTRSFIVGGLLNNSMDNIDPKCLTTPQDWTIMTYLEKVQAIIDFDCACCYKDPIN